MDTLLACLAQGFVKLCGGETSSFFLPSFTEMWSEGSASSSAESLPIPDSLESLVGLDVRLLELKTRVFRENVNKLGVSAMSGSGKTTLAAALCKDPEIKERFGDKIIYRKVTEFSKIEDILESIWVEIARPRSAPNFQSIPQARKRLQKWFRSRQAQNFLIVLDDMWYDDNDLKDLLFEANGYKTVVMSEYTFKCLDDTYELPLLEEDDALSLFCYWAFKQTSIPERGYNKRLVQQVAKECQGLPLALEVIGSSLYKESNEDCWKHAQMQLSVAGLMDNMDSYHVLKHLTLSIDRLDNEVKQCLLDLLLFPLVKEIHVDALFDIWIYVHNLNPTEAHRNLNILKRRRLLSVVNHDARDCLGTSHDSSYEQYIVQNDILKDLVFYWAKNIESENIHKRLTLYPLHWWEWCQNMEVAELIALCTDLRGMNRWPMLEFPNAQALVLIFTGNECVLPTFLKTMPKLKVLIIINENSVHTKLAGMPALGSLTKLKSLRLEKLKVPPLQDHCQSLKESLKKLSLCLCRGDKEELDIKVCSELHALEEINVNRCVDIKELHVGISNLTSLNKLIITNCYELQMIPDNLGGLAGCLEKLTLYACPTLKVLPESICELERLKFLDISKCQCLKMLPSEVGRLHNLQCLRMRECKEIKKLPESANGLTSLQCLICDEQFENQCSSLRKSIFDLQITSVELEHDLN